MRSVFLAVILSCASVAQATPFTFSNSGRVSDSAGAAINGPEQLTFEIYSMPTGGSPEWSELQSVVLANGYYSVKLGSIVAFDEDLFSTGPWFLQVTSGSAGVLGGRTEILPVPMARTAQSTEILDSAPVACDDPSHYGRLYFDTTTSKFRGCDAGGWGSLGGGGTDIPVNGTGTQVNPGQSCLDIHTNHPSLGDGVYYIDPDGDGQTVPVRCDMTRAGGGWTFAIKAWYQSGIFGQTGAVGGVVDALSLKGNGYRISDDVIRDVIGDRGNFDVLYDQAGFQSAESTGNYEYSTMENYTAYYRSDSLVSHSSTPVTHTAYRVSDNVAIWEGELGCGTAGGVHGSGKGINCDYVVRGVNPYGGPNCDVNLGIAVGGGAGEHQWYMGQHNSDTYHYLCNGSQHSSSYPVNHRWWFREHADPRSAGSTIGTQSDPGRTCKDIHAQDATLPDGIYWIDPDENGSALQVQCNMTYNGGGWTLGVKSYYSGAGVHNVSTAVGDVTNALTINNGGYKLSDADINLVIGPSENFDVLATQSGFQSAQSSGNLEYVVLGNYTGPFRFDIRMPESLTTTTMTSYRISDDAVAWSGNMPCGTVDTGRRGISCERASGDPGAPQGGPGCNINIGTRSSTGTSYFVMSNSNTDTYLYMCNGGQHSSSYANTHQWWFRERN